MKCVPKNSLINKFFFCWEGEGGHLNFYGSRMVFSNIHCQVQFSDYVGWTMAAPEVNNGQPSDTVGIGQRITANNWRLSAFMFPYFCQIALEWNNGLIYMHSLLVFFSYLQVFPLIEIFR